MDTKLSTNRKFKRMFVNILSIVVILAMAFPVTGNAYAQEPSPGLRAFPDRDRADGMFWPVGELVYLTINGDSFGSQTADNTGYVEFPLTEYDLKRGDTLTMTSGDISVTHTARQLFVANINLDAQTVSGIVDGGQQTVHVWTGDTQLYVDSDVDGNWSADFSGAADPVLFQGACGNVEAWEGQGSTIIDWCLPPPPPTPFFQVQLETNHVDGWNWKPNAQVTISISGVEVATVPTDEWGTFRSHFGDLEPFTPGMDFFITDGASDKTLTTAYLEITNVDPDADTVSGKATAGQTFNVWVHGPENPPIVQVTADEMGEWTADFSGQWSIIPGSDGAAQIDDEDGDGTWVPWRLPNPHFTVFPEWEWFDGLDWPDGATVSISVADKPKCSLERESWGGFFNGNFPQGCDIVFGDTVTFTDRTTTRTHVVRRLYVTNVDMATNTISGKADAGATVYVWPHDGWFEPLQTITADSGEWQVDLDDAGYNIRDDSAGRSEIRDEMGNATASDWHVTHPRFTVFPEWEWFDGNDWPNEAMVTITVEGKDNCTTVKESWSYFFNGSFGEGCDVVVGDEVTFTDGITTRTHTVRNLAITKVNQEDDTIKGTSDARAKIYVWPHATGQEQLVTANPKGKWNVDFTGIYDLMPGDGGRAEIRDELGNATAVDWNISKPRLIAFPAVDQVFGYYWPYGSKVNLTINGKHIMRATVQVAPWDPNDIMAFFDFGALHDLVAGDAVMLSGRDMALTYTVQNLTVTEVNEIENTVIGTADPGVEVMVYPFDYGDRPLRVKTDKDGIWFANFGEAGIDLLPGMCGRSDIFDEFTNSTTVDWCILNPTFVAYLPYAIEGYDWPIGDEISLIINDIPYPTTAFSEQRPDFPEGMTRVLFDVGQYGITLQANDHIVMTDESAHVSKEVWATNLAVTDFDLSAGTVSGTYDPAYSLWVWLYDLEGQVPETDPDNDTWIATFTELQLGVWGGATQWDADGDGTSIDFQVPGGSVGNFLIEWSQTNPEEVTYLSWMGSGNLTNPWEHPNCQGDLEFFGNSWVTETDIFWASLVGWGTTGTWENPVSGEINIGSISSGCPSSADIPIDTQYQFFGDKPDLIMIQRTFEFGDTPYAHDVRPFIPRLYPSDGFTWVIHPNSDGNELMTDTTCDFGCVAESWDGSWFAIHNPATGLGMIVQGVPSSYTSALWLDDDDGSFTNATSFLLLQPDGGFTGTVTDTEYLCFYDSSIWTPSLTLPEGCQP